jgi:hypothetical protein
MSRVRRRAGEVVAHGRPTWLLCRVGCHWAAFLPEEVLGSFAVALVSIGWVLTCEVGMTYGLASLSSR